MSSAGEEVKLPEGSGMQVTAILRVQARFSNGSSTINGFSLNAPLATRVQEAPSESDPRVAFAKRAAGYGAKVALVEQGPQWQPNKRRSGAGPGGTCMNVGCVPKKLMFMAAAHREMMIGEAATAKGYGFTVPEGAGKIDWKGLKERRDKYVAKLNTNYTAGWKKEGVEVIEDLSKSSAGFRQGVILLWNPNARHRRGFASFTDAQTVSVQCNDGTTRVLKGQHILVACGGLPSEPDIPGVEHAINSDGFFELEEQPKKVAVVGAGYIAVEMAGILHALGSETHLFFRGDTVLRRGFDPFIVQTLMEAMEHHGPVLHRDLSQLTWRFCSEPSRTSTPARISKQDDGRLTYVATEGPMGEEAILKDFDCILLAIGRKPVSDRLGLQNTGVELNKSGRLELARIYAIGDVTSTGYELTPVAIAAGRRLADRLFLKEGRARIAYELIATVVFSHPPIGCIGLTEPQAKAEFGEENIKVKQSRFASMLYAFNDDDKKVKTALKLDEMMQGFAVAVRMGATRADFEASVAIHPTIAEEFVTFGGWGQQQQGDKVSALLPPYLS
eukprot:g18083.t1